MITYCQYQTTYFFVSEALRLLACACEVRRCHVFWEKQRLARIPLWSARKEWLASYISPSCLKKVCILFRTPFSTSQVMWIKVKGRIRQHRSTLIWNCDTVQILTWVILRGTHFLGENLFTAISVHSPSTSCSQNSDAYIKQNSNDESTLLNHCKYICKNI
jgi:hypothetical protein